MSLADAAGLLLCGIAGYLAAKRPLAAAIIAYTAGYIIGKF